MKFIPIVSVIVFLLAGFTASAEEDHVKQISKIIPDIKQQIATAVVIAKINELNSTRGLVAQDKIDLMEKQWKEELSSGSLDLIKSVTQNPAADHLRNVIEKSGGLITEINVMDNQGFSVAQSSPNSDIWQGEESKWQKTYKVGPEAIFVDEIEEDKSTQSFQSQANFSVVDPETGKLIGAVSVGIDMETLTQM